MRSVLVARGTLQSPSLLISREAIGRGTRRGGHYGRGDSGAALHDEGAATHCFQYEKLDCHTQGEEEHYKRLNLEKKSQKKKLSLSCHSHQSTYVTKRGSSPYYRAHGLRRLLEMKWTD